MALNRIPALIFILLLARPAMAQVDYKPTVTKMTVSGTSTLHEWTSEVTQVDWTGIVAINADNQVDIKNVSISIPVKSIKSTQGRIMDNKTWDAFNAEKNPTITYRVTSYQTKVVGSETLIDANGALSMAGITKTIPLQVKVRNANGQLVLTGSRKLNMPEFKMDPPSAMMGTINVGPDVTVNFKITLVPNKI
ncbi:MAG: YceI family protein [Bacteroidota bacterium]